MKILLLWPASGMLFWLFAIWYYGLHIFRGFGASWWLMLFPACMAGPFIWIVPLIERRRKRRG